jgi:hypothetical protein
VSDERDDIRSGDPERPDRTSVERLVSRSLGDESVLGKPLSRRARQNQRTVEAYLKTGVRPRWMERIGEIDQGIAMERRRLERVYRALARECGRDAAEFARRWRARAEAWRFEHLNALIEQHNEWFPVERRLPMDPRTGDYVPVGGRNYRRRVLGPDWVLEQFPPRLPER